MTAALWTLRVQLPRHDFALDVDLTIPSQGITVICGASGAGKTTLLRCVAGLERAPLATIRLGDSPWQDTAAGLFVPPWQRALGYVFQEASLLAHLRAGENLRLGFRFSGTRADEQWVRTVNDLLGIGHLQERRVQELSGGERQRVAIARALALRPAVLLLDEPLASLDAARKADILPWLMRLRDELHVPMLYVTHAPDEVIKLADTLVVLERGLVRACGPVQEVLSRIDTPIVLGDDAGALLHATVNAIDTRWHLAQLQFSGGTLWVRDSGMSPGRTLRLRVLARDVSIALHPAQDSSIQNTLACTVRAIAPDVHPSQVLVQLACGEALLLARITARAAAQLALQQGTAVWAQVKSVAVVN